jgi:transposase InsO family protein
LWAQVHQWRRKLVEEAAEIFERENGPPRTEAFETTELYERIGRLKMELDWFSRYLLAWRTSNTLDGEFCVAALDEALSRSRPDIFNTDQGAQFTSREFTGVLKQNQVAIRMDGRGRVLDNVFMERLWRSVKYEVYEASLVSTGQKRTRSRKIRPASAILS